MKLFKIIFINFFIILLLIISFEVVYFFTDYIYEIKSNTKKQSKIEIFKQCINTYYKRFDFEYYNSIDFRNASKIKNPTKNDILLLGCSYTYGDGLDENKNFSGILSSYTNRTVYNLGVLGGSLRDALYILRNDNILNRLVPSNANIQYVIYTYIEDTPYRNIHNCRPHVPVFENINNEKLEYKKYNSIIQNSRLISHFMKVLAVQPFYFNRYSNEELYINEINKEVKKRFPNAKFIIFAYNTEAPENINSDIIKINSKDITHIDLNDKKYKIKDGYHPNTDAWLNIVPPLSKKLGL